MQDAHHTRCSRFQKLKAVEINDFSEFTDKDINIFFGGTYQLAQAKIVSYLAQMLDYDDLNVEYLNMKEEIMKILIRSIHMNRKTYNCYIEYKLNTIGIGLICRHSCDCPNSLRKFEAYHCKVQIEINPFTHIINYILYNRI